MDIKALHTITYGLYVVAAKKDGRVNGQIANTVFQISAEPATVVVSINKQNLTHEFIAASRSFCVSVLAKDAALSVIGHFGFKSGRELDKFASTPYQLSPAGLPYLTDNTLAWLEAAVVSAVDAGTHTIFIGQLTGAAVLAKGEPMTYAYYHQVKKGSTPKSAPTFVPEAKPAAQAASPSYRCSICNYVYEPAAGDPEHGVAPGTPFADLPADWVCPVCGAGKEVFEQV